MTSTGTSSLLAASHRRLRQTAVRAESLDAYVQALLVHADEAAALLGCGNGERGRITRIGLAFVSEDGLVVPVPFHRASAASLFIDQFHVMPLRATSLAPLLASGHGDRIDDMEAHLIKRGVSLSSQVALREGIRSNVRLPWFSLERRGFLWFSADTPRFFSAELFNWLESLVPEVELQLRLLNALEPLLPAGTLRPLPLEQHERALSRLTRLLEVEENPAPGRLDLTWRHEPAGSRASLVNLWRVNEQCVLLMAAECATSSALDYRILLMLRGWVLQLALHHRNPARLLEALDSLMRQSMSETPQLHAPEFLALALLHLDAGHLDFTAVGPARVRHEAAGMLRVLASQDEFLGGTTGRTSVVLSFNPGDGLMLNLAGRDLDPVAAVETGAAIPQDLRLVIRRLPLA